jgi:S1-C subfamily serine protease
VKERDEGLDRLHRAVLFTTVRVRTAQVGGSGTVIYSRPREKGGKDYSTFVLSCHHVIEDAITLKREWNALAGKELKREYRQRVQVEIFDYLPSTAVDTTRTYEADILAYDKDHDMALLRLATARQMEYVAKLYPKGAEDNLRVGMKVYAVGATLGHDPIITEGAITHRGDIIDYKDYMMSSAAICYGNSGGAVFLADTFEFIGIPSRVAVVGWGVPISHMGYFSPVHRLYQFLDEQMFEFIYDDSVTEADCEKGRKEKRDLEERKLQVADWSEDSE